MTQEHFADAVLFGSDESLMQHVVDGCKIMRRVVESEEEAETLREWVDNAVREFEVGKRPDLVDAAKAQVDVILTRRKAAGENNSSLTQTLKLNHQTQSCW